MTHTILSKNPDLARLSQLVLAGLATDADLSQAKLEDVRAIKTDNSVMHYRAVATTPETRAAVEGEKKPRSYAFVASEESRDRAGDIIRVAGWDHRNFKQNPIALADHWAATACIVGSVGDIQKATGEKPPRLYETITFAEAGVSEVADVCERLVSAGLLRTVSVGFLPLVVKWPESDEEREKEGLGRFGCIFEKQEQLELSVVAIPCHPAATLTGKSFMAERVRIARAVQSLIDSKAITKAAGELYLKTTDRRSPRTVFPVKHVVRATGEGLHVELVNGPQILVDGPDHAPAIEALTLTNAALVARCDSMQGELAKQAGELASLKALVEALPKPGPQPRSAAADPKSFAADALEQQPPRGLVIKTGLLARLRAS